MVKNAEEWSKCADLFAKHMLEWTDDCHAYRICMQDRLRKELKEKHGLPNNGSYVDILVPEWNTKMCRKEESGHE